ncbi:MAG: hypothetical protein CUN56_07205 [Phototrophicales bacterium]|nr:MAG: hypothetical protein CUN56_07205 [Phototrophicales bacterium]RMG70313.1 MAG: GAF domain-containing protein [Chloroflexota bacterium]
MNYDKILLNVDRLKALVNLALLDGEHVALYDRLTQLASQAINAPVSLLSIVAADHQYFKSHVGLPEPWKSRRRTPLSHSFCQHVVGTSQPLIVTDAREHELVKDNLAIPDLDVIGYLGIPLTLEDGKTLGSFCVIDSKPREWTELDIQIVKEVTAIVVAEFNLRVAIEQRKKSKSDLTAFHRQVLTLIESLDPTVPKETFLTDLQAARQKLGI